jgi:PhnB protein
MPVKKIPEGFAAATPYLCCRDARKAIAFYVEASGAVETMCPAEPNGRVGHAELRIGDAAIMLSDEYPEMGIRSPQALGGSPVTIHLYLDDVDAFARRAVAAGATLTRPVADQFYGDRSGNLEDPFGHRWMIATHVEDVSPEEMDRRYRAVMAQGGEA